MDASSEIQFDPREFRNVMGRFATGVTVITTEVDGQPHGMTANGFMSISLEPPLVLISVGNKARLNSLLPRSRRYGVSILSAEHEIYSRHFAGRPVEGLHIPFVRKKDLPVLADSIACIVANVVEIFPGGDHTLYLGQVEYLEYQEERPLLFYAGKYRQLDPTAEEKKGWADDAALLFSSMW